MAQIGESVIAQLLNEVQAIERDVSPLLEALDTHHSIVGVSHQVPSSSSVSPLEQKLQILNGKIANKGEFAAKVANSMGDKTNALLRLIEELNAKIVRALSRQPIVDFGDGLLSENTPEMLTRLRTNQVTHLQTHTEARIQEPSMSENTAAGADLLFNVLFLVDLLRLLIRKLK